MATRLRSLVSAFALAFSVLFFGPSTSRAEAKSFHAAKNHHGYHNHGGDSRYGHPYGYGRRHGYGYRSYGPYQPYYGSYPGYYGGYPAYRVVRVFVPIPYPHWVYRRCW